MTKRTMPVWTGILAAACAGCLCTEKGPITWAERGKAARYAVVLPGKPSPVVAYAAEELRDFTEKLTGVALPIITNAEPECGIYLDPAPAADGYDSFRLTAKGRDLHVSGNDRGVLYGVYELLETYGGVEFLTSWKTILPERCKLEVPGNLDSASRPVFKMRDATIGDARRNPEFRARLRLNGLYSNRPVAVDPAPEKFGGAYFDMARIYGCCPYAHTFRFLVPEHRYFKDYPEYYSEVNGVRRSGRTQLCLTNPDVLDIVVSNVLAVAAADPALKVAGISQDDNISHCTCAKCRAVDEEEGSPSGSLIRFLNVVAERVTKVYPDMKIETLAYQYTRKPPKRTKPHPSIVICLCPIECIRTMPLNVSDEGIPPYDAKKPFDGWIKHGKRINAAFCRDLEGWRAFGNDIIIWDYVQNYWFELSPTPDLESMQANFRYFRDVGIKYLFPEGMGGSGAHVEFGAFKSYLEAKWMWDPEIPYEKLRDRFLAGYYGKAAPFARTYMDRMSERWRTVEPKRKIYCFARDAPEIYDDGLMLWALDNWKKSEATVKDDPDAFFAVRMAELVPLGTLLNRWSAKAPWLWATREPRKFALSQEAAGAYKRVTSLVEEAKARGQKVPVSDRKLAEWKRLDDFRVPETPSDRAVASAATGELAVEKKEGGVLGEIVRDKDAFGGKTVKCNNRQSYVTVKFPMSNVAFDAGAKYVARVRVKVDKVPGGKGEVFHATLGKLAKAVNAEDVSADGYAWYDLGVTELNPDMTFEFSPGRFEKGGGRTAFASVRLDQFEIVRK